MYIIGGSRVLRRWTFYEIHLNQSALCNTTRISVIKIDVVINNLYQGGLRDFPSTSFGIKLNRKHEYKLPSTLPVGSFSKSCQMWLCECQSCQHFWYPLKLIHHNFFVRGMCTCLVHPRRHTCVKLVGRLPVGGISYSVHISTMLALHVRLEQVSILSGTGHSQKHSIHKTARIFLPNSESTKAFHSTNLF